MSSLTLMWEMRQWFLSLHLNPLIIQALLGWQGWHCLGLPLFPQFSFFFIFSLCPATSGYFYYSCQHNGKFNLVLRTVLEAALNSNSVWSLGPSLTFKFCMTRIDIKMNGCLANHSRCLLFWRTDGTMPLPLGQLVTCLSLRYCTSSCQPDSLLAIWLIYSIARKKNQAWPLYPVQSSTWLKSRLKKPCQRKGNCQLTMGMLLAHCQML